MIRLNKQKYVINFIVLPPFRKMKNGIKGTTHIQDKENKIENINVYYIQIPRIMNRLWKIDYRIAYLLTFPFLLLKTLKIASKVNPNTIICNYPSIYTGLLGWIVGKLLMRTIVIDFNDLIAQYTIQLLDLKKTSFTAQLLIFIQNFLLKNSNKIITVTHYLKKYVQTLGINKNVYVIPNGVDTELFNPIKYNPFPLRIENKKNYKLCLYAGRLEKWAGIDLITKLANKFKYTDIFFLLIGKENLSEKIFIEDKNIIIFPKISYENIPKLLVLADIILVPFPNEEVSHAASPLKLFEGMAMSKPIIASKVCGIKEVITDGENGLLAEPDNVEDWYQRILLLIKDKSLAEQLGKKARNTVISKYEWAVLAMEFERILNM
jgi:glycosyltransferase involved in cell wall biosynthesis